MAKQSNELSEILAAALDLRPGLKAEISSLLGGRYGGSRKQAEKPMTMEQRRERARRIFSQKANNQ